MTHWKVGTRQLKVSVDGPSFEMPHDVNGAKYTHTNKKKIERNLWQLSRESFEFLKQIDNAGRRGGGGVNRYIPDKSGKVAQMHQILIDI